MTTFAGSRVLVVGLGSSGFAAAKALLSRDAKVRVTESAKTSAIEARAATLRQLGAEVEVGEHDYSRLDADLAIVSPGIAPSTPVVQALVSSGVEIWSEVELAFRVAKCDFLAVTGTNGKTTTTSLLAAMLRAGGIESIAAGNIGLPLVDAVTSVPEGGAVAVEVSSFQLATTVRFHPKVAVLLNIAEDHTDWHGSLEAYAAAKARIVENQDASDAFVVNADESLVMEIADRAPSRVVQFSATSLPDAPDSIGVTDGAVTWKGRRVFGLDSVPLPGRGGAEDAIAAAGAALEYGVAIHAVADALQSFQPLPHRLQLVAQVGGVSYIDDSKATNPHATLAAVTGLDRVVLIAGGRSKNIDLAPLAGAVPPVEAVVALGEAAGEVEKVFEGLVPVQRAASMSEAMQLASAAASPGGSVLLSPGCASLDMYESYAARGDAFARAVHELSAGE
ncbi:MAG TPA: UDP-N-acetylmuramoyl-L-alanine--D-glutamate ligase [Actinomycetota bacterium]|nr:UDP-N-acetylmuramoyl-L-alanine--D-glutamate ligase [Actinomycetota bacterium]